MSDTSLQLSRERLAREQVGRTRVGRGTAFVLVAQFLLVVGAVPFGEVGYDLGNPGATDRLRERLSRLAHAVRPPPGAHSLDAAPPLVSRIASWNRALIAELERFGDDAEDVSLLGRQLRPPTQYLLGSLGAGNEKAYMGRRGWLFYRQDLDYVTGPAFLEPKQLARRRLGGTQPDPRLAILLLKAQLDARGIRLVLMPTPVKPTLHPERFASGFEDRENPLRPASYRAFIAELEQDGVLVFDPAPALSEVRRRRGAAYLMTDTHWRPEAVERVAARLRDFVTRHADLPPTPPVGFIGDHMEVTNLGDVARMLDLPAWQARYPAERVTLRQIRSADHARWRPRGSADVLLLGDSFSNIYSLAKMGWGESAGLAEQLSFLMQRPLDRIVQNADGAFATRELLARELARGSDRLVGKRLVIFQFAERELAAGDWKRFDLRLSDEIARRTFFVPEEGEEVLVSGTIREIAPIPRPGTVPYANHITAVHLVDLSSARAGAAGGQAIVYIWGMRDHVLQEAAQFRAGDTISVRLRPWADVARQYDGINRTELSNVAVQFEEPIWGEVVD